MHAGGAWHGAALPLLSSKWPTELDQVTWQGPVPASRRLKTRSDSLSDGSSVGNPTEDETDGEEEEEEEEVGDDEDDEAERRARRESKRMHVKRLHNNTRIFRFLAQRTPETTPPGTRFTCFIRTKVQILTPEELVLQAKGRQW
jgi:hypothetical protein